LFLLLLVALLSMPALKNYPNEVSCICNGVSFGWVCQHT